ncbi:MAG TPA: flavodoxin-dependent (E)-4-hydroxy-3-methylbut-2-enyl-diphosphate synthase [Candidatus Omnitrophota bacterium]|nr:flavodoxin-dependent (E)-4-hydroxy-3-methylbut-2-enyl-diphosphate synthase [Candidatus Omnitrophota bacterium]HQB94255.1 flavodoxin-dependent (E)-4-hydroxy-3-methylbut-2-enyl-diphosphate synthase [Candidatus Omnitrophota bacterium]
MESKTLYPRKKTRSVKVGPCVLGGGQPVRIQSMTKVHTRDVAAVIDQVARLEAAGCEIVRVACATEEDVKALGRIRAGIRIPLVADIHFNYRFALEAIDQGVDKLRINPGNIGDEARVAEVVEKAKSRRIPIRIGVNSGSLEKDLMQKFGPTPGALVESARRHVAILEKHDFRDIVISLKATDVPTMIAAYRLASQRFEYPLHLGVTEAGTLIRGSVYNAIGVGTLLQDGIGDTIRVSLTADPVEEVKVAKMILESLRLREGVRVISCPTCGRSGIDAAKLAREVEDRVAELEGPLTIAVMGCVVNGPGEAQGADFAITGGKGQGMIYAAGEQVRVVSEEELVDALFREIRKRRSPR